MNASSHKAVLSSPEAKAELRRRILEIVNRKQSLTDYAIWYESGPDYLPWRPMIDEIKALNKDKKLRLEIVQPGHWIIHSLEVPPAQAVKKTKPNKSAKRSGSKAKK